MPFVAVGAILSSAAFASIDTVRTTNTSDFACLRVGAELVAAGRDPYDDATWSGALPPPSADRYGNVRAAPCPGRFGYPLWTALAIAPLAALGPTPAAALWQVLLLAGTVGGSALAWAAVGGERRAWPTIAVVALASFPFWIALVLAQFGGLLLLLVGAIAYGFRGRRPTGAGLAVAALALKPHVAPMTGLVALWRGDRRVALTATAALAALGAGSLIARPDWPREWIGEAVGHRMDLAAAYPTTWALAERFSGDARLGAAISGLCLAGLWLLVRGIRLDDVDALALASAAWLTVVPYIGLHDELVLVLPWAQILAIALSSRGTWRWILTGMLLACASVLPWALQAYEHRVVGDETPSALVPIATSLLLGIALRARGQLVSTARSSSASSNGLAR